MGWDGRLAMESESEAAGNAKPATPSRQRQASAFVPRVCSTLEHLEHLKPIANWAHINPSTTFSFLPSVLLFTSLLLCCSPRLSHNIPSAVIDMYSCYETLLSSPKCLAVLACALRFESPSLRLNPQQQLLCTLLASLYYSTTNDSSAARCFLSHHFFITSIISTLKTVIISDLAPIMTIPVALVRTTTIIILFITSRPLPEIFASPVVCLHCFLAPRT